ncbi:MAG: NUDIX hydrolase [Candidatus Woesebacteria bacterium]|jgi:8-oxo-dGTP diphosphatase
MDKHNKHLVSKIGQYALIKNNKNHLLLLERKRSKNWSLPGGRLDKKDKDWKQALIREVKEETGLTITNLKPFDVKLIEDPYQIKYCIFFTTSTCDPTKLQISKEHSSSKWVRKEDLPDLVIDDEPKVREVLEHYFFEHLSNN